MCWVLFVVSVMCHVINADPTVEGLPRNSVSGSDQRQPSGIQNVQNRSSKTTEEIWALNYANTIALQEFKKATIRNSGSFAHATKRIAEDYSWGPLTISSRSGYVSFFGGKDAYEEVVRTTEIWETSYLRVEDDFPNNLVEIEASASYFLANFVDVSTIYNRNFVYFDGYEIPAIHLVDYLNHGHVEKLGFEFCEIPFEIDNKWRTYSMFLIYPHANTTIDDLVQNIDRLDVRSLIGVKRKMDVVFPKLHFVSIEKYLVPTTTGSSTLFGTPQRLLMNTVVISSRKKSAVENDLSGDDEEAAMNLTLEKPFLIIIAETTNTFPVITHIARYSEPQYYRYSKPQGLQLPIE